MFSNRPRKHERSSKSQLGQFLTPRSISEEVVGDLSFTKDSTVLEPGCGDGSFVINLIKAFLPLYDGSVESRLDQICSRNIYAVEIDNVLYERLLQNIKQEFGYLPSKHHFYCVDFFLWKSDLKFDFVVGNPPFGATIDYEHQDYLDSRYGLRDGRKIKKESYSFFLVKSIDHLRPDGQIVFICSDSFLTINTMNGLRHYLLDQGAIEINNLSYFSDETSYPMVILRFQKTPTPSREIILDGRPILRSNMLLTDNFSWTITEEDAQYFQGVKIGKVAICTSGMTIGKNAYFVRRIQNGAIEEPFSFEYFDDPITFDKEIRRSRLNKVSKRKEQQIREMERQQSVRRNIKINERSSPLQIQLPHPDYRYYNKAAKKKYFNPPQWAVFWKDDGDAVKTFKRNGNWYLHGVGGASFFGKEGFTWSLVSNTLSMRYLPSGYILDTSSPCGFLRDKVDEDELYYLMGWCNTNLATRLLKNYINHTRNIQGKDIEKLPYPHWVNNGTKNEIIKIVKKAINDLRNDVSYNPETLQATIDDMYS